MSLLALAAAQIALVSPTPVRAGVAAFPRIARPADAAQRRINTALTRLDAQVRKAVAECRRDGGPGRSSWKRRIEATMRGPAFVSFLVTDDTYCGGAHPNNGHIAIVYDMSTGRPVDWATLLPARLVGEQSLTIGDDGVRVVTLSSQRLTSLYRAGYRPGQEPDVAEQCRDVIASGTKPVALIAWLDARRGLALQYDLPHVVQACSAPVYLSAQVLRREGASVRLVSALLAARRVSR